MSNDIMSQEEIEKLLQSAGAFDPEPEPSAEPLAAQPDAPLAESAPVPEQAEQDEAHADAILSNLDDSDAELDINDYLTPEECDILGEIGNICMGTSATALYDLLEHKVLITTPHVSIQTKRTLMREYPMPIVCVGVHYTDGLEGDNVLLLKEYDVALITNLLLGGDGTVDPEDVVMDEIHLSAIREVMNQLVGSAATSIATMLNTSINISTPVSKRILIADDSIDEIIQGDIFVRINFKMEIEDLLSSQIMQIWPLKFAKLICQLVMAEFYGMDTSTESKQESEIPQGDAFLISNSAQSRDVNFNGISDEAATQKAAEYTQSQQPEQQPASPPQAVEPPPQAPQQQEPQWAQPQEPQPPQAPQWAQPQEPPQPQAPQWAQPQEPPQPQAPQWAQPQESPQAPTQEQQPWAQQPPQWAQQQQPPYGYPQQPGYPQYPPYPPYPNGQGYYPPYPGYPPYYPPQPQHEEPQQAESKPAASYPALPQYHSRVMSGSAPEVQEVIYPSFEEGSAAQRMEVPSENFNLIRRIPVEVSVVLGTKRLKIKDVLDFNVGTVVVLDKIAGEPVEVLVNGTSVAKGEVVVVDDNYGVRITEINTITLMESL